MPKKLRKPPHHFSARGPFSKWTPAPKPTFPPQSGTPQRAIQPLAMWSPSRGPAPRQAAHKAPGSHTAQPEPPLRLMWSQSQPIPAQGGQWSRDPHQGPVSSNLPRLPNSPPLFPLPHYPSAPLAPPAHCIPSPYGPPSASHTSPAAPPNCPRQPSAQRPNRHRTDTETAKPIAPQGNRFNKELSAPIQPSCAVGLIVNLMLFGGLRVFYDNRL